MIGVLGGTFDPIHFGHLRAALDCLQGLGLDQIRFVPLKRPVHRPHPATGALLRLEMLRAAIAGQEGFVADAREIERSGDSYTYDTLASLREEIGERVPLCLLIGDDAFAGFLDWHRPLDILGLAHLVVMRRPGHDSGAGEAIGALVSARACDRREDLAGAPAGRILFHDVTQLEISSTRLRSLIAGGRSPRYLVPDGVLAVIERERLYQ